jgi:hypothetical protein
MRNLTWIAILVALTQSLPVAYAQSSSGTKGGTYDAGPGGTATGFRADPLNPSNCGTPDEVRACTTSTSRHPLSTHKAHKPKIS